MTMCECARMQWIHHLWDITLHINFSFYFCMKFIRSFCNEYMLRNYLHLSDPAELIFTRQLLFCCNMWCEQEESVHTIGTDMLCGLLRFSHKWLLILLMFGTWTSGRLPWIRKEILNVGPTFKHAYNLAHWWPKCRRCISTHESDI